MRLIDEIQAAAGSAADQVMCGSITSMARALATAQCFELAAEVVLACGEVSLSKPSSLFSAMPLTRLPYAKTWIEWQPPPEPPHLQDTASPARPRPVHMGCLFEAATPDDLAQGVISWAWLQTQAGGGLMILPYAVQFDWRADGNVLETIDHVADLIEAMPPEAHAELRRQGLNPDAGGLRRYIAQQRINPGQASQALRRAKRSWTRLADNPEEQIALVRLMERWIVAPNQHCLGLLIELGKKAAPAARQRLIESWSKDLEGEPDFALAFVIMLNARSALELTSDDFSRLNWRRERAGKTPLREFVVTRLAVSAARSRQAERQGLSRADIRKHLVRGHFKIRSSGIFWWSPFIRGHGAAVPRDRYVVSGP